MQEKHRAQRKKLRAQSTGHRGRSSGHRAQGAGEEAQGSEHRAQGKKLRAQGTGHSDRSCKTARLHYRKTCPPVPRAAASRMPLAASRSSALRRVPFFYPEIIIYIGVLNHFSADKKLKLMAFVPLYPE